MLSILLLVAAWGSGAADEMVEIDASGSMIQMPSSPPRKPRRPGVRWLNNPQYFQFGVDIGFLDVHLDPQNSSSPIISLEIQRMNASKKVSRKGALLLHEGGPGSDASSAQAGEFLKLTSMGFDTYGISQRGIGDSAKPSLNCQNYTLRPPPKKKGPYQVSDFTTCPCRMVDGTPLIGETWADIEPTNRKDVWKLFAKVAQRSQRCRESFQMEGNYNFLDYAGTQMLAHDIDKLREAIGEDKISLYGISYGTYVAGVYSSVYPHRVNKVVMDGNVVPMPDKMKLSEGAGIGLQQAINKMLYNCMQQSDKCSLQNPERDFSLLLRKLKRKNITALTNSGNDFPLTTGLFGGWIQKQLSDSSGQGWKTVPKAVADLLRGNTTAAAGAILDSMCQLEKEYDSALTWREYDVCIGNAHVGGGTHSFMTQLGVLGADLVGRYTVKDAAKLSLVYQKRYRALATGAFAGIFAGLFQWPVVPTPPAPLGNPTLRALIVGNLYDSSTSYAWSQEMHKAFPRSKMLTWQGVGHGLAIAHDYDKQGAEACIVNIRKYLNGSDDDVLNGYVCRLRSEIPVGL